jgi:hypothetical protein
VVLFLGYLAGSRSVGAVEAWRQWHEVAESDPSAADLYRTTFQLDAGMVIVSVVIASVVWWLLRPPRGPRLP